MFNVITGSNNESEVCKHSLYISPLKHKPHELQSLRHMFVTDLLNPVQCPS